MTLHKSIWFKVSLALILTFAVGFGLFINSRPAKAVEAILSTPSQSSVTQGTAVTFNAEINFTNPNEVIPIEGLELVLSGPVSHVINFSALGGNVTGSTSVLSVSAVPVTALGAGYGYAFGYAPSRFGYINGSQVNFGGGYGYGPVGAFPSAVGYIQSFNYTFTVNTSTLPAGSYTLVLNVNTGPVTFSSAQRTFTVTTSGGVGAGPTIPTTPVTTPGITPSPSTTVTPPAADSVVIAPVINFEALATVIQPSGGAGQPQTVNLSGAGVTVIRNAQGQATAAVVTVGSGASGTATITIPVNASGQVTGNPTLTVTSTAASVTVSGNTSVGSVSISSTLTTMPTTGTATISIAPPSQIPASTTTGISSFVVNAGGGSSTVVGAIVFDHPGITSVGATTITFTIQNPGVPNNLLEVIQESSGQILNPPQTFTTQPNGTILVTVNATTASTFAVVTVSQPIPTPTPTPTGTVTPTVTGTVSPTAGPGTATATGVPTTPGTGATPTATPRPGSVGDVSFSGLTLALLLGSGLMMLMLASMAIKKAWK